MYTDYRPTEIDVNSNLRSSYLIITAVPAHCRGGSCKGCAIVGDYIGNDLHGVHYFDWPIQGGPLGLDEFRSHLPLVCKNRRPIMLTCRYVKLSSRARHLRYNNVESVRLSVSRNRHSFRQIRIELGIRPPRNLRMVIGHHYTVLYLRDNQLNWNS